MVFHPCQVGLSALWHTERSSRFPCFSLFHFLVILVLGLLGFAKSKAAGWAVAVILNFAICTAQLSTGGSSFTLNNELSSLRLRAKTQSLGFVSLASTNDLGPNHELNDESRLPVLLLPARLVMLFRDTLHLPVPRVLGRQDLT